jgi:CarboxypepD_reg-like domain/TonB dependent receptor-like, beta-barrel/TonB-dependent Receptor Plug Domain
MKRCTQLSVLILFLILVGNIWAQSPGNRNTSKYTGSENVEASDLDNDSIFDNYLGFNQINMMELKVSINSEDCNLSEILSVITEKTGLSFIYDSKIKKLDGISIKADEKKVSEVLDQIFDQLEIGYMAMGDNQIILARHNSLLSRTGGIKGQVHDESSGDPLINANVIILENKYGCAANDNGEYKINNLSPGIYTVKVSYLGYNKASERVEVKAGRTTELDFNLTLESFMIGNIEVIANNEFIPLEPETKTKISSGEIEHMQASSLGDVLELSPGTKTTNPTLNEVGKAIIRGGSAFGTQIIMDEVPISNNINMQIGIGLNTANSGLDLRSIPAENIESVEIIRGVPSAKYGDFVDGLMIVKTKKAKASPLSVKLKYNPNVNETNIRGGFEYKDWVINSNFNLASSGRDVRIDGDGYTRIAAQVNATYGFGKNDLKNSFYFTRTFDELKEDPAYDLREAWYNKDFIFRYNGKYTYAFSSFEEFNSTFSISYTKRDSYKQRIISRDNMVITDRLEEGPQEGHIVFGSYLGKQWIKGNELSIYSDINYSFRLYTGEFLHSFLGGINWRGESNNGDGKIFDPLFPPSLSIPSPRIRTYNDLPGYNTLSVYLEDKITGNLFRPFTLQIGARYEVYRPDGINLKGLWGDGDIVTSQNGSYLNPRINFSCNIFDDTQLRLSYGVSTKAPALGMIYAQDKYFDIVDTVSVKNPEVPDSNFAIVSTYIRKAANPDLKASKQFKYEISLDQEVGFGGFSVTAFLNKSENNFGTINNQTVLYKNSYPNWPDPSIATPIDTFFNKYSKYEGTYTSETKGIELSLRTKKIPHINTIFKFDAAYYEYKKTNVLGYRSGTRRFVAELNQEVIPFYNNINNYTKNLLINYRFDIQAKSLGMWITLHVQQQVIELSGTKNKDDIYPVGYYTKNDEMIFIPEKDRMNEEYKNLNDSVEPFELFEEDMPNTWSLNVKVSKSLWKGAALSFFVNNFFNNRPLYKSLRTAPNSPSYERRNTPIFYGMEFNATF